MDNKYILLGVLLIVIIIIIIIAVFIFRKNERYSSGPISFNIFQDNYINLVIENETYKVMLDTGSPNLVITAFDTSLGTAVTTDQYDSYTIYGGRTGTAQECITAVQTGGQLSSECVVQKYYNTNKISITQPVTVSSAIYGSIPNIMGLAMPGLLEQGSPAFKLSPTTNGKVVNINPVVNWNTRTVQNFTVDFSNNVLKFNDTDQNFIFCPRVRFYGFNTDLYVISCQTQELGPVNIVFDTGTYDCVVPSNINTQIQQTGNLTITAPFSAFINSKSSTYQSIPQSLNFLIMGYTHMQTIGKIYFGANHIGIGSGG